MSEYITDNIKISDDSDKEISNDKNSYEESFNEEN